MSDVIKLNIKNGGIRVKLSNDLAVTDHTEEAKQDREDYYQRKLEENYSRGFSDGQRAAAEALEGEFSQKLIDTTEEFNAILQSIEEKLVSYEKDFDKLVVNVALKMAEKIINRSIEKETIITNTVTDSLKRVIGANEITIRLNPADYQAMQNFNSMVNRDDSFSKIRYEKDERIEQGGCFIETDVGNVDSRISTQLNGLYKDLENALFSTTE